MKKATRAQSMQQFAKLAAPAASISNLRVKIRSPEIKLYLQVPAGHSAVLMPGVS